MAEEEVELLPSEPKLAFEGLKGGVVDCIYLLYDISGYDKTTKTLYLRNKGDLKFRHRAVVPDDVMKAVEIAAASDKLRINSHWDSRGVIQKVVIYNY